MSPARGEASEPAGAPSVLPAGPADRAPVVPAGPADRASVVRTVVAAFSCDPAWAFICGGDYERVAPIFARALFDGRVREGTVWMTPGASAVAMWDAPGTKADRSELWGRFRRAAGEHVWERLRRYDEAVGARRPAEPFWYLGVLASAPAHRNRGLASAVIGPALARADREGLAACLETSTAGNRRFYENRGFTEAVPVEVAGGPATWWMTRRPPV